jgi:hypothetical protein
MISAGGKCWNAATFSAGGKGPHDDNARGCSYVTSTTTDQEELQLGSTLNNLSFLVATFSGIHRRYDRSSKRCAIESGRGEA